MWHAACSLVFPPLIPSHFLFRYRHFLCLCFICENFSPGVYIWFFSGCQFVSSSICSVLVRWMCTSRIDDCPYVFFLFCVVSFVFTPCFVATVFVLISLCVCRRVLPCALQTKQMGFATWQVHEDHTNLIICAVIVSFLWVIYLSLTAWYFYRRNVPSIAARSPRCAVVFPLSLFVIQSISVPALWYPLYQCEYPDSPVAPIAFWLGNACLMLIFTSSIWRTWALIGM